MSSVYISLGSNLGNREQYLRLAKEAIGKKIGNIVVESSIYKSKAIDFEGNDFYNQVVKIETLLTPDFLLQKTQEIEKNLGRKKKTVIKKGKPVYSNRIIDIDILLYDDLQIDTEILKIPHPKMYEREFVRLPLAEIQNDKEIVTT